jgi:uncharacterized RDD family membrane protein YckC
VEEVNKQWISGFWRRIGALFTDTIILAILGYSLGLFLEDIFVQLGDWGRLVGLAISIAYFGVMNSSIANGQTVGKKLLNIRVVDAFNATLSLPRSCLRYSVFCIPFLFNGLEGSESLLKSFLIYPLSMIVIGGLFSIVYLYVFNRATRQCLHDVVVGSYVVNVDAAAEPLSPIWKPHLAIVATLFGVATFLPVLTSGMMQMAGLDGLFLTHTAINKHPEIKNSSIVVGSNTKALATSGNQTTSYVAVVASLSKKTLLDNAGFAKEIAQIVVDTYPEAHTKDYINVTFTYGYRIGIASSKHSFTHGFNPAELKAVSTK